MKFNMVLILFLFSLTSIAAGPRLDERVISTEQRLQKSLNYEIRKYLGENAQVGVYVKLIVDEAKRNEEEASLYDLGYLPRPLVKKTDEEAYQGAPLEIVRSVVNILVYDEVSQVDLDFLKEIASSVMLEFNPKIEVKKAPLASAVDPVIKMPEAKVESKDKEKIDPLSFVPMFIKYGTQVFLSMLALFGIFLMAKSFIKIIEAFSASARSIIAEWRKPIEVLALPNDAESVKAKDVEVSGTTALEALPNLQQKKEIEGHIKDLKIVIKNNPNNFLEALEGNSLDGLRTLLHYFNEVEKNHIKKLIDDESSKQLYQQIKENKKQLNDADFNSWLKNVNDRVLALSIKSEGFFEKALTKETLHKIHSIAPDHLIQVGMRLKKALTWKLIFAFLSDSQKAKLIQILGKDEWTMILTQENLESLDAEMIASEVLLEAYSKGFLVHAAVQSIDGKILESAINIAKMKPIGEDEKFIASLEQISPHFAQEIQNHVWVANNIKLVPTDYVASLLQTFEITKTKDVLKGLPVELQNHLMALLPDNKAKLILSSDLANFNKSKNSDELKVAQKAAKDFINELFQKHKMGEFQISDQRIDPSPLKLAS